MIHKLCARGEGSEEQWLSDGLYDVLVNLRCRCPLLPKSEGQPVFHKNDAPLATLESSNVANGTELPHRSQRTKENLISLPCCNSLSNGRRRLEYAVCRSIRDDSG